jgi:hypothetical protein
MGEVLRYAEFLATATLVNEPATVRTAFGDQYVRPIAAKLLADVCGFLVTAAGLGAEFRAEARARLVNDLTGGDAPSAEGGDRAQDAPAQSALPLAESSDSTGTSPSQ